MTHLPPVARFRYCPGAAVDAPFDVLVEGLRRAGADVYLRLDACAFMEDGAGALVVLAKVYLSMHGDSPSREIIQRVLPLGEVAKARARARSMYSQES